MSWISSLVEAYDFIDQDIKSNINESKKIEPLTPILHNKQKVDLIVTIDIDGNFKSVESISSESKNNSYLIPVTPQSDSRTSGTEPHPLADNLGYVAGDLKDYFSTPKEVNKFEEKNSKYLELIGQWSKTESYKVLQAINKYVNKKSLIKDLLNNNVLAISEEQKLIYSLTEKGDVDKLFVVWSVIDSAGNSYQSWSDENLISSWIDFCSTKLDNKFCFYYGENKTYSTSYSCKISNAGDREKIISSNDSKGFTYRGRAIEAHEAATISVEASYKLHAMLRWLKERGQSFTYDNIEIISWANLNLKPIVLPTLEIEEPSNPFDDEETNSEPDWTSSYGFQASKKLKEKLAGFSNNLSDSDKISIIIFKSASPGRRSILYFREMLKDDYLRNINKWIEDLSWTFSIKGEAYEFSPSPWIIVNELYGNESTTLKTSILSNLIPIQINNLQIPWDLVSKAFHNACNPLKYDNFKRRKNISLACSIYKGYSIRNLNKEVEMSLNLTNKSRDYLYGRLLAVAQAVEDSVIKDIEPGSKRDTSAERYFQRFSTRPYTTWKVIYDSLKIYSKRYRFGNPDIIIGEIMELFDEESYKNDKALSPEFLLGYHCQLNEIYKRKGSDTHSETTVATEESTLN
ncbi:type I-C CRISPR-associated protein Cas8c/Csd1 [Taylorella equigenitalis]|uniref:CRISPR protein, Cas8 n=1 Tax=Taylorella equigenitalis ATCC 35865 TaxID=743973 RepID=A0ABM5N9F7_9BURK|nr:type I-C CRISPR-associated protein Cas8c/Csd1 [Taylorella equigenitalis]AFN35329.1 CRISPR protein, Cas8 [Taylorella equigenitalis ATCC 35865]ASY37296.1 type I-C CRISPR-associated protein Cas8c/Csd1 [Taylorella equigenitalis]ASY38762.1 type I-C CRISPR-associated protein Cas8c/Csd1 [Taylorella equigenitalis]ASY40285.1 type I-C CRISPR-associated protein Cas8c/Csd1 [Taylorella equigenitalis]ASY41718.1 type I-C CRISPR-associated protein Cas8c/Csd1 [Taylorella equigenitalis]